MEREEAMEYTPTTYAALRDRAAAHDLLNWKVNEFTADVFRKGDKGELSPRQWEALVKAVERAEKFNARKAEWEARDQALVEAGVRLYEGTGELVGKVVSVKYKDDTQWPAWKMTVELTAGPSKGAKVWGTVPRDLDYEWTANGERERVAPGDEVRFTAQVTPSDNPTFGFFKRPRKAEFVSRVQPEQEDEGDGTLGPCGCSDYHYADCPTRTGGGEAWSPQDRWESEDYR